MIGQPWRKRQSGRWRNLPGFETFLRGRWKYISLQSWVNRPKLLATKVDWSSRKLRPLLQHASLANYNGQLINWKLDDQIYRDLRSQSVD
jgi:hypothetical protein